jgi:hypothetical protein
MDFQIGDKVRLVTDDEEYTKDSDKNFTDVGYSPDETFKYIVSVPTTYEDWFSDYELEKVADDEV